MLGRLAGVRDGPSCGGRHQPAAVASVSRLTVLGPQGDIFGGLTTSSWPVLRAGSATTAWATSLHGERMSVHVHDHMLQASTSSSSSQGRQVGSSRSLEVQHASSGQAEQPQPQGRQLEKQRGRAGSSLAIGRRGPTRQPWPLLRLKREHSVPSGAGFIRQCLVGPQARALVVASGPGSLFRAVRMIRNARAMLAEDAHIPVFQPVLLPSLPTRGHAPAPAPPQPTPDGPVALYIRKLLRGSFVLPRPCRVSASTTPHVLAPTIAKRLRSERMVVLESFGSVPAATTVQAAAMARSALAPQGLDLGVVIETEVVEVDNAHIGTTIMNRFIVFACAPLNPTEPMIRVTMRLRRS